MSETMIGLRAALGRNDANQDFLSYLEQLDVSSIELYAPEGDELREVLRALEVPEEVIRAVEASRPKPNTEAWWLLERCVASLVQTMGNPAAPPGFPPPMDIPGMDPYFYVHVFVATLPYTQRYHRERGIPEEIARATLADLGRNVRVHHKRYGTGGMGVPAWISLHFRGTIYHLGRLQFERTLMRESIANALRARGEDVKPTDLVLSIHIPDFLGPLTPEACDASIASAREFFATYFPDEAYRYGVCHSWLLDPQLADYLSEGSNIVRFQRRFELAGGGHDADRSILQFVFGPAPDNLSELPQRSTLERAVVSHLQNGGHWYGRSGWFPWK